MEYKKCFIPSCKNDSKNSPNKLIVRIREDSRKEWCRQANVQYFTVYNMYCCEDHFDPKEDLKNYYTFKSRKLRPIFKPTAKLRHISSDSQNQAPSPLPDCSELLKLLQDPSLTNNKRKHKDTSVPSSGTSDIIPNQVALIIGISGACRGNELVNLKVDDIKKHSESLLVNLRDTKNRERSFTVPEEHARIVEKYQALRPSKINTDRFFVGYINGKCTRQVIGRHKISGMPKEIAKYLKLQNPELYTGHCFRRTSASLLAGSGADTDQMRHGGWKPDAAAEGHIEHSIQNKNRSAAAQPGPSAEPCPETSRRDDQDNSDTNLPSRTDYPLNKRTIDQCRFCGDFTRDCFDLTTDNKPYIEKNKTSLTVNGLSVELDFNDDTLPKTVCHNCDGKLQEMLDFVTIVKAAQDTLINVADEREIETVIVKVEEPEDNDEDEESDDKAATEVSETQRVAKTAVFTHKRKSNKLCVQQKKRKVSHENINNSEFVYVKQEIETDEIDKHGKPNVTNVKCENDELTIDIKEENIEIDSREALHSEIDTGVDVKPDEQELATHAFVYGMSSKRS